MKNKIIKVIAEAANVAASCITPQDRLEEDLGLDSISLVELQMQVEDAIDDQIEDEVWLACRTVQDVIDLASQQIATH